MGGSTRQPKFLPDKHPNWHRLTNEYQNHNENKVSRHD